MWLLRVYNENIKCREQGLDRAFYPNQDKMGNVEISLIVDIIKDVCK
jgi:hypothetical protein